MTDVDKCPTCGRDWPVDSLRSQCEAGFHLAPPSFGRVTPTGRIRTDQPDDQVKVTGL